MFQFTIRKALLITLYFAVAFAIANLSGFEFLMSLHVFVIHFILLCVLPVAAWEYRGHQRRFAIAALFVEITYLFVSMGWWFRDDFVFGSLIGFAMAYLAGLTSAAAYRAIVTPEDDCNSWRPLDLATRGLCRLLPRRQKEWSATQSEQNDSPDPDEIQPVSIND